MEYDHGYPTEPIGGDNPYYRCIFCHVSDPEINGRLEGHRKDCEYRKCKEEQKQVIEDVKLWEIMVPCQYNDGDPVRTRHHKEWDKYVRRITGGLTIFKPAKGQWVDPETEQLYDERMIPVRIACTEAQITKIGYFTIRHYCQIAVMITLVSERVIMLYKKDDDKSKEK